MKMFIAFCLKSNKRIGNADTLTQLKTTFIVTVKNETEIRLYLYLQSKIKSNQINTTCIDLKLNVVLVTKM